MQTPPPPSSSSSRPALLSFLTLSLLRKVAKKCLCPSASSISIELSKNKALIFFLKPTHALAFRRLLASFSSSGPYSETQIESHYAERTECTETSGLSLPPVFVSLYTYGEHQTRPEVLERQRGANSFFRKESIYLSNSKPPTRVPNQRSPVFFSFLLSFLPLAQTRFSLSSSASSQAKPKPIDACSF